MLNAVKQTCENLPPTSSISTKKRGIENPKDVCSTY